MTASIPRDGGVRIRLGETLLNYFQSLGKGLWYSELRDPSQQRVLSLYWRYLVVECDSSPSCRAELQQLLSPFPIRVSLHLVH